MQETPLLSFLLRKVPYCCDVVFLFRESVTIFLGPEAIKASLSSGMQSGALASQLQGVNLDSRVTLSRCS